jgi:hypothetical protein
MGIDYENDLLKHFVRVNGWLPACERRLRKIRREEARRLRYFTFCAVGAVDVLMLDVERIIRKSSANKFDTVVFFDRSPESVLETQKRIPGAIGFPGDFVNVVLATDAEEALEIDDATPLNPPEHQLDKAEVRRAQLQKAQRVAFLECFPFDVINLDLEEFLFKPRDPLPGKVINAFRKLLEWQKKPLQRPRGGARPLTGFSLMFTTQIGPPNIGDQFLDMLQGYLRENLQHDVQLEPVLRVRAGTNDLTVLRGENFDLFFKLAMPKVLAAALMEADWYIDPVSGIRVFQFQRESVDGPYQMLHLVIDVLRQTPPREQRAPGASDQQALDAYTTTIRTLFQTPEIVIALPIPDQDALIESLRVIRARRRLYYPDDE